MILAGAFDPSRISEEDPMRGLAVLASLAMAVAAGGCSNTVSYKYTFDPSVNFAGAKTYAWINAAAGYSPSSPLEEYIQFNADKVLETKGWKKVADKPELVFSVSVEHETLSAYQLRLVDLRAVRKDTGDAVWRGTAFGSIDSNAASPELRDAVSKILATFPPT
jgi:Domain of unknown function (DUF4136)